jgi:hypothetical protein
VEQADILGILFYYLIRAMEVGESNQKDFYTKNRKLAQAMNIFFHVEHKNFA